MTTALQLDGATRLYPIIGDPIAQVKSPAGVTAALQAAGLNALIVPLFVPAADFAGCMTALVAISNVDGGIVTVPHKFAAAQACAQLSERAAFLGAVNTFRRSAAGGWHGDMFDGVAYVLALRKNNCEPQGKKVLLVGAGGAGSAIAHALLEAGAAHLALYDANTERLNALIGKLRRFGFANVTASTPDPRGFDIAINATPAGMRARDALPMDASGFAPTLFVGDVITAPAVTPLLALARAAGCATQTGAEMFASVRDLMVDFLLRKD